MWGEPFVPSLVCVGSPFLVQMQTTVIDLWGRIGFGARSKSVTCPCEVHLEILAPSLNWSCCLDYAWMAELCLITLKSVVTDIWHTSLPMHQTSTFRTNEMVDRELRYQSSAIRLGCRSVLEVVFI